MNIKGLGASLLARKTLAQQRAWKQDPIGTQNKVLSRLLKGVYKTAFGMDHKITLNLDPKSFSQAVPVKDYEGLKPYIDRIKQGESNVLWPGKPLYLAKTSGTTSGAKYIPISDVSIKHHINGAKNTLLTHGARSGNFDFLGGKLMFLSGSPVLEEVAGIKTGRLSGIVNHHVPSYLKGAQLPSYPTNCIDDWETKLGKIVEETYKADLRLISGIPPWMVMYFQWLREKTGRSVGEVFPNLSLLVHGGVNFEPYKDTLLDLIGRKVDMVETFPASEGYFAFSDVPGEKGLLLQLDAGIYYEFIPVKEHGNVNATRVGLEGVELGVNYAIVLHTDAGLWGYDIGDTVQFISLAPHRVVVTGRTKHFISAFGEHVIAQEVDDVITKTSKDLGLQIIEYHVAPQVNPKDGSKPYHEWFVELQDGVTLPPNFAQLLDKGMQDKNIYYLDLRKGEILAQAKVQLIGTGGFTQYMKTKGKLGGQNKLPRLHNHRDLAQALGPYLIRDSE